jgi:HD-GYP domain-containing protein (c-di-GMP phosphodiesterase class II)
MTLVGEIAAVANTFDNLTSGVHGATPLPPDEAMIQITAMAGTILNEEVVSAFRRVTPVYPVGTQVLLRGQPYDGFLGVVMSVAPSHLAKPRVILARDAHRNKIPPEEIETAEHPKLKLKIMGL